jgi:hypothetical protein
MSLIVNKNWKEIYETNPETAKKLLHVFLLLGSVRVVFKKVNGDIRDMLCTINPKDLPPVTEEKELKQRKDNGEACRAFDVNKQEWRSFRYENVLQILMPWEKDVDLSAENTMQSTLANLSDVDYFANKIMTDIAIPKDYFKNK